MEGTIVAMHSRGFMIKPDGGAADVYFHCPEPHEAGWDKHQRVAFTLAPARSGETFRSAASVEPLPHLASN